MHRQNGAGGHLDALATSLQWQAATYSPRIAAPRLVQQFVQVSALGQNSIAMSQIFTSSAILSLAAQCSTAFDY